MLTIHLHTPECPDVTEYAVNALSDAESIALPKNYYGFLCESASLHLVNEIALNAFRLAVAQGQISPKSIRVRIHLKDTVLRARINKAGVLVAYGEKPMQVHFPSAGDEVVEEILLTAVRRRKGSLHAERTRKIKAIIQSNCKGDV